MHKHYLITMDKLAFTFSRTGNPDTLPRDLLEMCDMVIESDEPIVLRKYRYGRAIECTVEAFPTSSTLISFSSGGGRYKLTPHQTRVWVLRPSLFEKESNG